MRKYLILFLIIFPELSPLFGQNGLSYFIEKAQENSVAVYENDNLLTISHLEENRLTREITGPQVFFTADYLLAPYFNNRTFIDTNPENQAIGYDVGITNGGLYSGLINAKIPLLAGRTLNAHLEIQRGDRQNLTYSKKLAMEELKRSVTTQYILVYNDQELIRIHEDLLKLLDDQETIARELVRASLLKKSQQILLHLEKLNEASSVRMLKSQWNQDLFDLYTLCGLHDSTSIKIMKPDLSLNAGEPHTSMFVQKLMADSLSIAATAMVFNSRYNPALDLFGDAGLNAVSLDNIQRKLGFSVGARLTIPLYDGGQRSLNMQKTKLLQETLTRKEEVKRVEVENNLAKYLQAINVLREHIRLLNSQQTDYNLLFDTYQAELKTGQISVIELINGTRAYRQSQVDLINAHKELWMNITAFNYWNW